METPDPTPPNPDVPAPARASGARRAVLRTLLWGGGVGGLSALAGVAVSRCLGSGGNPGTTRPKPSRPPLGPEFTYDVSRYQTSDPALARYRECGRFPCGMKNPRALAAGGGSLWVGAGAGLRRFSETGELLSETALPQPVLSLVLRPDGGMLCGHEGGIRVLDPSGAELAHWRDFEPSFLPTALALAGDAVYAADAGGRQVLKLDDKGAVLMRIGAAEGKTGFVVPSPYFCVRMAPDGLLRVANPGEKRVEAYTADGELELHWGGSGMDIRLFAGCCNPCSFEILADGSYITCEKGLPRVKLYDSHGDFAGVVAGPEAFPEYLAAANTGTLETGNSGLYAAAGADGRVFIIDCVSGVVKVMEPLGKGGAP